MYTLYGTSKIPKGKAATFGYQLFETKKPKKLLEYINTHAIIPSAVEKGHRLTKHVVQIFDWIRLDLDGKGELKKVEKRLKNVEYFKKPSTSNDGKTNTHKWHIFVPIENASQSYDAYKLQYHNFLAEHKIEIQDVSLSSVVQNTNPRGKDGIKRSSYHKGKIWVAPTLKAPKRKKLKEKHSDVSKADVKRKLMSITKHVDRNEHGDRVKGSQGAGYEEFLKIGMALYDWCPKRGFKLYKKWAEKTGSYYADVVTDKWDDFERGSLSGEVTIGSLFTMNRMGQHEVIAEDVFEPVKFTKKQKKAQKEAKKALKGFDPIHVLGALTKDKLKDRENQTVLFDSVLVERMHTFLYGESGSNKTTVIGWMMAEVLKKHQEKVLHFWSFDASQDHENSIYNYITKEGLDESRYMLLADKTAEDFFKHYQNAIDIGANLSRVIIVIDTFKFISANVNDKNANKKAMHFIKKLQKMGATVLSIGHTNKDGIKQSGTAEIEQDSDAILRIDRAVNEGTGEVTLSISNAGRARFACEGVTFSSSPKGSNYNYLYSALTSMCVSDKFVDIASTNDTKKEMVEKDKFTEVKKHEQEKKDLSYIKELVRIIKYLEKSDKGTPIHRSITQIAKAEESMGKSLVDRLLRDYNETYWLSKPFIHPNGGKPTKMYKSLKKKK